MFIPICSTDRFTSPPKGLEAMRTRKGNGLPTIGFCLVALAMVAGCAPHFRAAPQLQEKLTSIKTVAIMPPGVTVYQLGVTGAPQVMEEKTAAAKQIVSTAIEGELGRHAGVVFKPFPSPSAILDTGLDPAAARLTTELEDTQALFEAVSASIMAHTYKHGERADSDWRFVEKLTNFDYSLGPDVQHFAKLANADALLFSSGVNYIPTRGMAALYTLGIFMALSPGGVVANPGFLHFGAPATSGLSVALVDARTGALLWYNTSNLNYFLTNPETVAQMLEGVFYDFPLGTKPTWDVYDPSSRPTGMGPE